MPLLDHFRPPLFPVRRWEAFHSQWAAGIAASLNQGLLPEGYFAESEIHVGGRVEVDVASFRDERERADEPMGGGSVAVATQSRAWVAPPPPITMAAIFPDSLETLIYTSAERTLVAALELVSPGNKDRPETRRVFAAKCATYLSDGIGLVIVDIVTKLRANLHNDLVATLGQAESFTFNPENGLYATSYRPFRRRDAEGIDLWPNSLELGRELPIVPLAIRADLLIPIDLEATYQEACRRSRLYD